MQNIDIEQLLMKHKAGTCSPAEKELLENWYLQWNPEESKIEPERLEMIKNEVWQSISSDVHKTKTISLWPRIAAAASIIICLSVGTYFLLHKQSTISTFSQARVQPVDIQPGGNKAILLLADGKTITLDNAQNGSLAQQGNTAIIKKDNQVVYDSKGSKTQSTNASAAVNIISYNTLVTPRGGQYKLTLPDGSKVWLNAASSIKFPTSFTGAERRVEITGEAYFEVASLFAKTPAPKKGDANPSAKVPFIVNVNGMEVKVLGTHFNINAYNDESTIKTSLLEGKVQVTSKNNNTVTLSPGQQSTLSKTGEIKVSNLGFDETVTAWKDGYFRFDNDDLPTIMRQFERWYDVEVVYEGQISDQQFIGKITRNAPLSRVLRILQLGGVKFRIEGKKLIVT